MQFSEICGRIYELQSLCFWKTGGNCFRILWERGRQLMVEVTKINGVKVLINPDLLELVEETPDTVLSFTTGRKIIVKESRQEVKNLVKSYRKDIFAD
ncbi:MAG: flagellar FlbD family protein [Bacteroidales bacterium]|nr:flagellar FlbD family protein [Bacteroidales bacterium]MCM1423016.1 flagellar FlbD family protein [bacterium]